MLQNIRLAESENYSNGGVARNRDAVNNESVQTTSREVWPCNFMAPFDEKRDDLDAHLDCFQRIAKRQGWPKSEQATILRLCLTGEALATFRRMSSEESLNYEREGGVLVLGSANWRGVQRELPES